MYLPDDVYEKEFSHMLNRLPGLSHEKNKHFILLCTFSLEENYLQRQETKCQSTG